MKYKVFVTETVKRFATLEVEAANRHDAKELAHDLLECGEPTWIGKVTDRELYVDGVQCC